MHAKIVNIVPANNCDKDHYNVSNVVTPFNESDCLFYYNDSYYPRYCMRVKSNVNQINVTYAFNNIEFLINDIRPMSNIISVFTRSYLYRLELKSRYTYRSLNLRV